MEIKKMSLAAIQGKLSRAEMKNIMAGSGGSVCSTGLSCTLYVGSTPYPGTCEAGWGGGSGAYIACGCSTQYGPYNPISNGGVSRCIK
jgi:hypothetical protein